MRALKAQWVVTAEVIPGHPLEKLTKVWEYTSEDYEKDCSSAAALKGCEIFNRMRKEANAYAEELQNPYDINVVNLKFMWM